VLFALCIRARIRIRHVRPVRLQLVARTLVLVCVCVAVGFVEIAVGEQRLEFVHLFVVLVLEIIDGVLQVLGERIRVDFVAFEEFLQ